MQRHAIVPDVIAYRAAISACGKCQQHQQDLTYLRATRRHVIAPDVFAYSAAISACEECRQHQQALHLLRAMQRHAIVPDVVNYSAAISACGSASSTGRPYISYERRGAMPSCRM